MGPWVFFKKKKKKKKNQNKRKTKTLSEILSSEEWVEDRETCCSRHPRGEDWEVKAHGKFLFVLLLF
jgi:hypothetical protein